MALVHPPYTLKWTGRAFCPVVIIGCYTCCRKQLTDYPVTPHFSQLAVDSPSFRYSACSCKRRKKHQKRGAKKNPARFRLFLDLNCITIVVPILLTSLHFSFSPQQTPGNHLDTKPPVLIPRIIFPGVFDRYIIRL